MRPRLGAKRNREPRNYTHRTVVELVGILERMIEDSNPLLYTKPCDSFYQDRLKVHRIIKEMKDD